MRRVPLCFLAVLVAVCFSAPAFAQDDTVSFVIAPPPVGYPEFKRGSMDVQAGGNAVFLSLDALGETIYVFGGSYLGDYQWCVTDRIALNGTFGVAALAGSDYGLLMGQAPLHVGAILEALRIPRLSLFVFGGGGADFGISTMTISIPYFNGMSWVTEDTNNISTTVSGTVTAGAQVNYDIGNFIISPFGVYTYSGGTFHTKITASVPLPVSSLSGSISGYSTTIFGFDVLYKPWKVSLSSQFQQTDRYYLVSLAMRWLLDKAGAKD